MDFISPLMLALIAGLSAMVGAAIVLLSKKPKHTGIAMGFAAGVMIYISFVELLNAGIDYLAYEQASLSFFIGVALMILFEHLVPHHEHETSSQKLKKVGIVTSIGIFIHNFPEGLAVFLSSLVDIRIGISIALAIAMHNIPEGIVVAAPIYKATGSRKTALKYSFISSMAEPVGALFGVLFLPFITEWILYASLCTVAGIMVFICFDELLPVALRSKHPHRIVYGLFLGMLLMALSLMFF